MARGSAVAAALIALVLGIVSVALSFIAYSNRIKPDDVEFTTGGGCIYPKSSAYTIGIVAAVVLLVEQIVITAGTGCFCCRPQGCPSTCAGITAILLFVFSWISFIISFTGLIYTAVLNNNAYLTTAYGISDGDFCILGRETLFVGAAIWCIITTVLGLLSHIFLMAHSNNAPPRTTTPANNFANEQGGVAIGHPQMHPKPQY